MFCDVAHPSFTRIDCGEVSSNKSSSARGSAEDVTIRIEALESDVDRLETEHLRLLPEQ